METIPFLEWSDNGRWLLQNRIVREALVMVSLSEEFSGRDLLCEKSEGNLNGQETVTQF